MYYRTGNFPVIKLNGKEEAQNVILTSLCTYLYFCTTSIVNRCTAKMLIIPIKTFF